MQEWRAQGGGQEWRAGVQEWRAQGGVQEWRALRQWGLVEEFGLSMRSEGW